MADVLVRTPARRPLTTARILLQRLRFPIVAFSIWRVAHLAVFSAAAGLPNHDRYFRWDGNWYWGIMVDGYVVRDAPEQPTNFFPLLPWVTQAVRMVVRNDLAAALLVTTIAGISAVCLVYLVIHRWRGLDTARWAVVLLLAFPGSIFLWLFYPEGLLVALAAGAVLCFMDDRPAAAAVLCTGAAMARPNGILLALILGVGHARRHGLRRAAPYALAPAGVLVVVLAQYAAVGTGFAWLTSNAAWGRELTFPLLTIADSLQAYFRGWTLFEGWSGSTLYSVGSPVDLAATFLFLGVAWTAARRRWPATAQALVLVFTVVPLATGMVVGMARYVLLAWPAFGVLAETRARTAAAVVFGLVSVAVVRDSAVGLFVG